MRFLVLGGSGQLGTQLREMPLPRGVELVAPARAAVDLGDLAAIRRIVAAQPWSVVIDAAGYTHVDRAESEEELAFAINAEAAACLAAETGKRGIPLIYVSTDYVFDGRKGAPYVEKDLTAPLNAYGRSKLAGERRVSAANPRHVILRTAWLYSPHGANFVRTILRLAQEREHLTVVADQRGCPTSARDLAQACLDIARRCAAEPERTDYGLYHFAGAGAATWFELAGAIVEQAAGRLGRTPRLEPISTAQYSSPAARPADSRLDCTAIQDAFGLAPRPWRRALAETVDCLLARRSVA
jgi:dTDP-4-dehydrorhamnose reductase